MTNGEKKKILMSYRRLAQQEKAIIEQIAATERLKRMEGK